MVTGSTAFHRQFETQLMGTGNACWDWFRNNRAHHKAEVAKKRNSFEEQDYREALGYSRGSYGPKVGVIADGHRKAICFGLAPRQLPRTANGAVMLDDILIDKGYASGAFRKRI